jgi:hypothetical protein
MCVYGGCCKQELQSLVVRIIYSIGVIISSCEGSSSDMVVRIFVGNGTVSSVEWSDFSESCNKQTMYFYHPSDRCSVDELVSSIALSVLSFYEG